MSEETDMTVKVIDPTEVKKDPQLVLVLVQPLAFDAVMARMKTLAEEMAEKSGGEYSLYTTYLQCKWGTTQLYYGYVVQDIEAFKKLNEFEQHMNPNIEREFVGYVIISHKLDTNIPPHIWQASIIPKYYGTNVFELGVKEIEKVLRSWGAKEYTMSSPRSGWQDKAVKMGFNETFTIYRHKLE